MPFTDYRAPVAQLLELGLQIQEQTDDFYRALGLSAADVPQLCRLAKAGTLRNEDADDLAAYGSVHAWRALGELRAEDSVDTLIGEFCHAPEDDWVMEELPAIMAQIGPIAIPALAAYCADDSNDVYACSTASSALAAIAGAHPAARERCVALLASVLAGYAERDAEFNALLIGDLLTLRAIETAPLMEQAFAADAVELAIVGDWEEVQIELGLLEQRLTPQPDYYGYNFPAFEDFKLPSGSKSPAAKAKKAKRKQQAKSRQRNRKK